MKEKEIAGIKLDTLEDPIRQALITYEHLSDDRLGIDVDAAAKLELTPDKPNSARSATPITFNGQPAGMLYVIGFKPEDGSGDEKTFSLKDLSVDSPYPTAAKVVPRSKSGVHSEGLLTIVSQKIESPNTEPELFNGTFDLLGLDGTLIRKIGELGHQSSIDLAEATPLSTYTVGHRVDSDGTLERFGDPHAVFSSLPDEVQFCAFLAVSDEVYRAHPEILTSIDTQEPRK